MHERQLRFHVVNLFSYLLLCKICHEFQSRHKKSHSTKTPPSYCEIYGLHISGRNKLSGQKRGYFTNSFSGFLLFLNKLQIVNSMAFKLPFQKGKCNSDGSLDCHGLPLFEWKQLRDKEEAIGRGSYGLVCATFYAATKTHGKFSITKGN